MIGRGSLRLAEPLDSRRIERVKAPPVTPNLPVAPREYSPRIKVRVYDLQTVTRRRGRWRVSVQVSVRRLDNGDLIPFISYRGTRQ